MLIRGRVGRGRAIKDKGVANQFKFALLVLEELLVVVQEQGVHIEKLLVHKGALRLSFRVVGDNLFGLLKNARKFFVVWPIVVVHRFHNLKVLTEPRWQIHPD